MKKTNKTKFLTSVVLCFVVFFSTLFALADNKNSNSLFLDSDQDGLIDQEEKALGTNPNLADTDGDGYSDGKEVESGFNPLKPAPGDKIVIGDQTKNEKGQGIANTNETNSAENILSGNQSDEFGFTGLTNEAFDDLSSDPQNPNLTNEMLGNLMQLSKEKAGTSEEFLENPSFSADDYAQIAQKSIESASIKKSLPEIKDSEIKVLPAVDDSKLEPEEVKEKQKKEIEKYLASTAYVIALNSPFAITSSDDFEANVSTESTNLLSALTKGDQSKIDSYAEKADKSIKEIKQIEVPFVLKDFHKSALALAIYTAEMKNDVVVSASDPMKGLASLSALQKIAEVATKLQTELKLALDEYGIEFVDFE